LIAGNSSGVAERRLQKRACGFAAQSVVGPAPALNIFVAIEYCREALLTGTFKRADVFQSRFNLCLVRWGRIGEGARRTEYENKRDNPNRAQRAKMAHEKIPWSINDLNEMFSICSHKSRRLSRP
jgi:hypothetical protein